jgi:hypothetical protein
MISHLRYKIRVQIQLSPIEGDDKIIHDQDRFFIYPIGEKENRETIKRSLNGFCEKYGLLPLPKWPSNFIL